MTMPDMWARSLFRGPGEVAARMREVDWAATTAGPVESWPQSLKATVRTMLGSRYPMIVVWGEDELIQIYNDAYTGLIGAKHPYALGRSIKETQSESWDTIGPMIREVMTTGVPNWVPAQLLALDRAGFNEESYFSLSYSPVEDDEGAIKGMLCVCSEVTAQVLAERRLKLQRDLASTAGETRSMEDTCADIAAALAEHPWDVPFALVYLRDGPDRLRRFATVGLGTNSALAPEIVALNGAEAAAPGPLARAATGETMTLDDLPGFGEYLRGGPWSEAVRTALALPIPGASDAAPLGALMFGVNPNGALDEAYRSFFELLASQISTAVRNAQAHEEERRRAEALAELDRAKTQFFSNVSHEFRTPLTLMLGPVEDLLERDDLAGPVRDELTIAHRNALRLLRLVNTLLDFSRVEAGRATASFEAVDLCAFTAELASTFRSAVEKAGLTLEVNCHALPEPTYVDRDMWEKIVLNLISNAFKHTFEGRISVSLHERQDGPLELVVADTGVGIPADQLDRVFKRFFRVEGTRSRTHEGSGIGLALVRELVHLHHGAVAVDSVPGQGTSLRVTLPPGYRQLPAGHSRVGDPRPGTAIGAAPFVAEALRWSAPEPDDPRAGTAVQPPQLRARIILADDNADMRAYVVRLLRPDYDVVAVADGKAALDALRAGGADLLLTDIMMPVMDGFRLLKAIRGDAALKTTPVIMLSARAGEEANILGLEAGADDYLVKPFSARELLARVTSQIELARLRRDFEEQTHQTRKMEAIGQLTGGIAHDFNNLLAVIVGSLDLAGRHVRGDDRVTRLLQNALQAAQRGAKLTSQLLAFSRRQRLEAGPVDVNLLISAMGDLLYRTLGGNISVSLRLGRNLWPALADANQLELAILNLAINARDAMPDGGGITIQTRNANAVDQALDDAVIGQDAVVIDMRDTGCGMSADVLARAFEPFFTTKDVGKGTGLGLAQVYGTVKQLGGEVRIDSRVGEGTAFRLYLPRAGTLVTSNLSSACWPLAAAQHRSVLLVDDDPEVRSAAADMVRELGHHVTAVASGADALLRIEGDPFDLLLADQAMPGMTGLELAAQAKAVRPGLQVLLVTGYPDPAALSPAVGAVLRKPFSLEELRAALDALPPASALDSDAAAGAAS
jgi:signal transduction histidine kinase